MRKFIVLCLLVPAGQLFLLVSLFGAAIVTVENGSTLTGATVVNATVQPASGGKIAPGNGVGTLTVDGLVLSTGSILDFELATGTSDFISVTGSNQLVVNGGGVHLYHPGTTNAFAMPGTYRLIGYTGALQGSAANLQILNPLNGAAYRFNNNTSSHTIELVITSPLRITSVVRLTNGQALLQGSGVPNATHTILAASEINLGFGSIGSAPADSSGHWEFEDTGATRLARRFYRLSYP